MALALLVNLVSFFFYYFTKLRLEIYIPSFFVPYLVSWVMSSMVTRCLACIWRTTRRCDEKKMGGEERWFPYPPVSFSSPPTLFCLTSLIAQGKPYIKSSVSFMYKPVIAAISLHALYSKHNNSSI